MKDKSKYYYVELFAGSMSFAKVFRSRGFRVWTVDKFEKFGCDYTGDILEEATQKKIIEMISSKYCLGVWMSPVCTGWSLAAGNTHWTAYRMPKTQLARDSMNMMMFCRLVADICIKKKKIFWIENPNGRAVWIMDNKYLKRLWYCQYGDSRAKPTNIWTNLDIDFKTCSNGNKLCGHEAAPRGSKTGTQGLKGNYERSIIPSGLFHYIHYVLDDKGFT